MKVIYRLTTNGLVVEPFSPVAVEEAPRILATSAKSPMLAQSELLASKDIDRDLCKYRKGFLDQFKPRAFVMSTIRVAMQQGTLIMANYMSEQLEGDMKRTKLVDEGKISQTEADEQGKEWEAVEWEKRWKVFPQKMFTAFAKYHVITLVMRTYEHLAAMRYDLVVMNKLTMDPFSAARNLTASEKKESSSTVAKEMFHTTFWANLIAYMADYSVHQAILCYGYYVYVRRKREKEQAADVGDGKSSVVEGYILTSMLRKSTQLFVSRAFALFCSAIGGGVGTVWWPGWGTLLLSNVGEGAAGVIMEDGQAPSSKDKDE